jgi:predicted nucleotidyltransferase
MGMDRQAIIARPREMEPELCARGDSDTDILVEFNPEAGVGVYEYVGVKRYIASLLDGPVDVVDAICAF